MRPYGLVLILLGILGLGGVSLCFPTAFWAGLAWTISSVALLSAVLRAFVDRGERRAWWLGFLAVGSTYFVLSFDHSPLEFVEGFLPTTRVFDAIYLARHAEPKGPAANAGVDAWDTQNHQPQQQAASTYYGFNQIHFRWAWHSLTILLVGVLGGELAVRSSRARLRTPVAPRVERRRSIRTLMAAVVAAGGAFAALHSPSWLTMNLAFGLFGVLLSWAGLEAAVSRGRRRAFAAGFALFGWMYLLAAFGQFDVRLLVYGNSLAGGYLPTSRLLGELFPHLHRAPEASTVMIDAWNPAYHRPTQLAPTYLYSLNRYVFVQIGHSLFGIAAGVLGGLIAAGWTPFSFIGGASLTILRR